MLRPIGREQLALPTVLKSRLLIPHEDKDSVKAPFAKYKLSAVSA